MILPRRIDAVIFDMDGTLHDTETVYDRAQRDAAAALGYSISDAFWHSLIGIPGIEADAMLQAHLGPDFPFDHFDQDYRARRDALLADGVKWKPGVGEILGHLAARQMPIAVATSASRRTAEIHLACSGLRPSFKTVITRDDVARGKPHPDPFLLAAASLSIAPEHCLVIEDAFTGIRAAHAAGMMPVLVPDILVPTAEIRALCVAVLPDLHAVLRLLAV